MRAVTTSRVHVYPVQSRSVCEQSEHPADCVFDVGRSRWKTLKYHLRVRSRAYLCSVGQLVHKSKERRFVVHDTHLRNKREINLSAPITPITLTPYAQPVAMEATTTPA